MKLRGVGQEALFPFYPVNIWCGPSAKAARADFISLHPNYICTQWREGTVSRVRYGHVRSAPWRCQYIFIDWNGS